MSSNLLQNLRSVAPRLAGKIAVAESGCWTWTGYVHPQGYGVAVITEAGRRRWLGAHRVVYQTLHGPVPDGLELDHLCHTADPACRGGHICGHRRCVNPAHLETVTSGENTRRGRSPELSRERRRHQTHCARGHAFTPENTHIRATANGSYSQVCRSCERARYHRRSSAAPVEHGSAADVQPPLERPAALAGRPSIPHASGV